MFSCDVLKNSYFVERLHIFLTMFFFYIFQVNDLCWIDNSLAVFFFFFFFRSSRLQIFHKKSIVKSFTNSTENTCAGVSVLIKLPASRLELYSERNSRHRFFPVNFVKFLRRPILKNTFELLLLRFEEVLIYINLK